MTWPWLEPLNRTLHRWTNTPWQAGQRWPQRGTDCVNFVDAVLCELSGRTLPALPRVPQDVALHDRRRAVELCSQFARRHPHVIVRDGSREPGDVIVCRVGQGPSHVMIVARPPDAWHAIVGAGVCRTSITAADGALMRVLRPLERVNWR